MEGMKNKIAEYKVHIKDTFDHDAQIITEYNSCVLCGSNLEFTHVTNFIKNEVCEVAHCQSCDIQNKNETHELQ